MAENEGAIIIGESTTPNPFSPIISKFTQLFNFQFPPPPVKIKPETDKKPVTVSFDPPTETVAPVKLDPEEMKQNSSPLVVWQVYAIGGFFVLKWMVGRWKERRGNKKSSNADSPPTPTPTPTPQPAEADK